MVSDSKQEQIDKLREQLWKPTVRTIRGPDGTLHRVLMPLPPAGEAARITRKIARLMR